MYLAVMLVCWVGLYVECGCVVSVWLLEVLFVWILLIGWRAVGRHIWLVGFSGLDLSLQSSGLGVVLLCHCHSALLHGCFVLTGVAGVSGFVDVSGWVWDSCFTGLMVVRVSAFLSLVLSIEGVVGRMLGVLFLPCGCVR